MADTAVITKGMEETTIDGGGGAAAAAPDAPAQPMSKAALKKQAKMEAAAKKKADKAAAAAAAAGGGGGGGGAAAAGGGGGGAAKKKGRAAGKGAAVVDEAAEAAERAQYVDFYGGPLAKGATSSGAAEKGEKFYITTAINYTNGPPHIGHAYEAITTDAIARYHRAYGRDVHFLTGTDEHGQKIADSAEAQGVTPQQLCDKYAAGFEALNKRYKTSNDFYIRTTMAEHERFAQWIYKRAFDAGDIYLGQYVGWYNVKEEAFVPDNEAELAGFQDAAGNPLEKRNESTYMFRMSKYQERLLAHYAANPTFLQPEDKKNIILKRLEEPLRDLSTTRTTFEWGVPIPDSCRDPADGGAKHVMYVWFDALSNYLSGITTCAGAAPEKVLADVDAGADCAARFWPADAHVIGKDITWFHCVIWPCMLMSAGIPLYKSVVAHGFVQDEKGEKMSKSVGNVVDPNDVLSRFPSDSFRYYIASQTPYGSDLPCSEDAMVLLHNSLLNDTLGNLVHRATTICHKYCEGKVPAVPEGAAIFGGIFDLEALRAGTEAAFGSYKLSAAAELAFAAVREVNGYLTRTEPWKMKDDRVAERTAVVRTALEAIFAFAHFISPFMPDAASGIFWKLGTPPCDIVNLRPSFDNLAVGTTVHHGAPLFKKIESAAAKAAIEEKAKALKAAKEKAAKKAATKVEVDPNQPEFTMLEIKVGTIVKVWEHPEAEKLWCEEVDVGEEGGPRSICSGLRDFYSGEQMLGRRVAVLANLKPRKLQGFESNGMVLCAVAEDGKTEFVEPPEGAAPGERIFVEGMAGPPAEPNKVGKRDRKLKTTLLERVQVGMKTIDGPVAAFEGKPLMTSAGPCVVASLVDAFIK